MPDLNHPHPKKAIAAKVIFKSQSGNILLVKPTYKPTWQFPGGAIEPGESPIQAAVREAKEEVHLAIDGGALKLLEAIHVIQHDSIILVYEYTIPLDESQKLQYAEGEIEGYKFERPDKVRPLLAEYYLDFWTSYSLSL